MPSTHLHGNCSLEVRLILLQNQGIKLTSLSTATPLRVMDSETARQSQMVRFALISDGTVGWRIHDVDEIGFEVMISNVL